MEDKTDRMEYTLKDVSTSYKLHLSESLVKKIEYVCKKLPSLEWSGILFYKTEGSFEEHNLSLVAVDMCIQDIGSSGATEFDISPDITGYIVDKDLIGFQMGLIHSHNTMATFFSGTDRGTLLSEGTDRNHFLSLIVNNAGTYTAKITRKIEYMERTLLSYRYKTFEDVTVEEKDVEILEHSSVIEAFSLDIIKDVTPNLEFEELDKTLEELRAKKAAKASKFAYSSYGSSFVPSGNQRLGVSAGFKNVTQQEFPFQKAFSDSTKVLGKGITKVEEGDEVYIDYGSRENLDSSEEDMKALYEKVHISEKVVDLTLKKLLKGTPLVNPNMDLVQYAQSMKAIYEKTFDTYQNFTVFASTWVEYLIYETSDKSLVSEHLTLEEEGAILANALLAKMELLPANEYLDHYKSLLGGYIL